MSILKQSLAPITNEAWEEINEEASQTLKTCLSARKFIKVEGPKGFDFAAVAVGKLDVPKNQKSSDVQYGIHQVQPMIEIRMPFELDVWELDNLERGAEDIDLDNLVVAAKKAAKFEEEAIYKGFAKANVKGLLNSSEHKKLKLNKNKSNFIELISQALLSFNQESITGPFNLVVGTELFKHINKYSNDYPIKKHIEDQIKGNIFLSEHIDGAIMVAAEDNGLQLTLGSDFAIGYHSHDTKKVNLYLTESFTFQIIDPATFIVIE